MRNLLIGLAVVAVLVVGAVLLYNSGGDSTTSSINTNQSAEPAAETASAGPKLIIGDPNAPLTIVEYGDFQCPICERFFSQTEPQLRESYINSNQVNIEFRVDTHIGPDSVTAGEAAYCANDQGQFTAYHDALYERQGSLRFTSENLKVIAKELGLSQSSFDACLDGGKYRQTVVDSNQEAKERTGNATPTFFVGEQVVVGAQPFSSFKALIDAQL